MAEQHGSDLPKPPFIHPLGRPFILLFFLASVALGLVVWGPLFWVGLVFTLWCAWFFRDPVRTTPLDPALVTSPADGFVCAVKARVPPPELGLGEGALPCVGIFMNVFDVHVNRTPVPGRVLKRHRHEGRFVNASFDKASDVNERVSWLIETEGGGHVGLVQIAGLVARRIVPFVGEGVALGPGERVGMIRFGSRCDVYFPDGVRPQVLIGQRAVAGETVLARLDGQQSEIRGRKG
ncbi:MAG: phosphatidylserine decarboxylase [Geminicoccaceae bacterium]|nr:phosphatidylserine decarboxylase [Geminicoccaceae bacterium]